MDRIEQFFIRPQRQKYFPHDLGPSLYISKDIRIKRTDFSILNTNNCQIQVSLFENDFQKLSSHCVVYLHTHHGSKLQGLSLANKILHSGANFCLFDFSGYGNSEGKSVTLGYQEKFDIQLVIQQLKKRNQKQFILWGRSMGAVAALLYNEYFRDKSVLASVYDSPFCSLEKLTLQLCSKNSGIPQLLLRPAVGLLKVSLKDRLDFGQLQISQKVKDIKIPGYFIASKVDTFISYYHSQLLYEQYGGKKTLQFIEQDHNQNRNEQQLKDVFDFIKQHFDLVQGKMSSRCNRILLNNLKFQAKREKQRSSISIDFKIKSFQNIKI